MPENKETVLQAIDDLRPEMIEFTRQLIAIPTENPPGNQYERCARVILEKLNELGLTPRLIQVPVIKPDEQSVYCVLAAHGEGERVLHFHGHYDVVPPSLEGQFEPALRGG
jgi:succinyl-diaminopimelate desuccinylase